MKTKHFIYPLVILLALVVPVARYYASTPDINACMQVYIDNLEYSNNKWYIYEMDGRRHIEAANSINNEALQKYLVWESQGCMMYSNDIINDLNNTIYCAITYMIKKSPMSQDMKKPLALLKTQ